MEKIRFGSAHARAGTVTVVVKNAKIWVEKFLSSKSCVLRHLEGWVVGLCF